MASIMYAIARAKEKRQKEAEKNREDMQAREAEHSDTIRMRKNFLESVRAVPTPPALQALWVAQYVQQGGDVKLVSRKFTTPGVIVSGSFRGGARSLHTKAAPDMPTYDYHGFMNWMSTVWPSGVKIPAGYGALSLI